MKNILVVAPNFIGDSILAIAFLRELKKHVGRCNIDVVTKNAGILTYKSCPYVRYIYDWKKLDILRMREIKYEKAYLLKRSLSSALLAFCLGIKDTIGFNGQFRELFLTKSIKYVKNEKKHELEHFFDILKDDYIEVNNKKLEFYVNEKALENIKKHLGKNKKALIVAKSSTNVKDWNEKSFAEIVDYLISKGYDIYFAGLESEREYCSNIILNAGNGEVKNLCGKLSFDEVVALISQMDIVCGVDSGFCHVASAFNKKIVVLFGPTSVNQWQPINSNVVSLNMECSPCNKPKNCKNSYACMQNITPEMVIDKLNLIL